MVLRLVLGILAVVFLPLGVVFVVLGLVVENPDRGRPEDALYTGAVLAAVGLAFGLAFLVLWRREAQRRRRRREGARAMAQVVGVRLRPNVRSGGRIAADLTVRFDAGIAGERTETGTIMVIAGMQPAEGAAIEIFYDPSDPSNFEPVVQH